MFESFEALQFTLEFIQMFSIGVALGAPLLLFLVLLIVVLGLYVGRREGWCRADALYYAFITATTVGYGDFRPKSRSGKYVAILIALVGLLLTGIIVAIGLEAAATAFKQIHNKSEISFEQFGS